MKGSESVSHLVVSFSVRPPGLEPARLLWPWILQSRILEWVAIPFSRGSSQPRNWTWFSCVAGRFFTMWATDVPWKLEPQYSMKTVPKSARSSVTKCFHFTLICGSYVYYFLILSSHGVFNWHGEFNKWIIFTALPRTFLSENDFLLLPVCDSQ